MFIPDNINFAESKKYILSIRLIPNGFYFSIHCPTDASVFYQNSVAFRINSNYLKNIEKLIFDYSFFSYNYQQIMVICVDDQATIVPNEYHDRKLESDLLSFNCLYPKMQVINNEIKELDCRVLWGMDKSVHNFLSRTLLNPKFVSHLSLIVPMFYKFHNKTTSALFINFNDDRMIDAVAFSNEKLILAKTFRAENSLEDSYYIQKTWEIIQFNSQLNNLFFSGKTEKNNDCIHTLKKVVSKTENLSFKLPNGSEIKKEEVPTEILNQLCEL